MDNAAPKAAASKKDFLIISLSLQHSTLTRKQPIQRIQGLGPAADLQIDAPAAVLGGAGARQRLAGLDVGPLGLEDVPQRAVHAEEAAAVVQDRDAPVGAER